ncbi:hypothetical protein PHET_02005 [Paragonimus heterotremus]|uniref:Uncharacterized protein n=1 Tax=Paragonimus heterotremus TaxID=100268 RepID=A0A8J4SQY3_9TREM|nr:hypothetical protein PHET_02005 [Paragonimus heterotremus]
MLVQSRPVCKLWSVIVRWLVFWSLHLISPSVVLTSIPETFQSSDPYPTGILHKRALPQDESVIDHGTITESKTHVKLMYGITADRKALITCEVNVSPESRQDGSVDVIEKSSISALYLVCPQVIEDCKYDRVSPNRVLVNYVINLEALDNTGQWNCDYRGQRASRPLELRAAERRTHLTTTTQLDVSSPPSEQKVTNRTNSSIAYSNSDDGSENILGVNRKGSRKSEKHVFKIFSNLIWKCYSPSEYLTHSQVRKSGSETRLRLSDRVKDELNITMYTVQSRRTASAFSFKITRPEIVVILFVILIISLLFNIILSVRCALTKNYLDNVARGKVDPRLNRILCFQRRHKPAQLLGDPSGLSTPHNRRTPLGNEISSNCIQYTTTGGIDDNSLDNMLFYPTPCLPQRINGNVINSQNVYRSIYNPPPSSVPTPTLVGAKTLNGLYGQGNRAVFSDDPNSHQATQVTSMINFNPMGTSMIQAEGVGNGIPNGTNGSLTGSLVLTNDSASFTDGLCSTAGGNPFLLYTRNPQEHSPPTGSPGHNQPESSAFVCGKIIRTASGRTENHRFPITAERETHFLPRKMTQSMSQRSTSPESYDCTGTARSARIRPSMTPLVVRFPSGEAGLLICPSRTQNEPFYTGSLSRPSAAVRTKHSVNQQGELSKTTKQRQTTNSTLVTTDTESESGCAEMVLIGSSKQELASDSNRQSGQCNSTGPGTETTLGWGANQDPHSTGGAEFSLNTPDQMETSEIKNKQESQEGTIITRNSIPTYTRFGKSDELTMPTKEHKLKDSVQQSGSYTPTVCMRKSATHCIEHPTTSEWEQHRASVAFSTSPSTQLNSSVYDSEQISQRYRYLRRSWLSP